MNTLTRNVLYWRSTVYIDSEFQVFHWTKVFIGYEIIASERVVSLGKENKGQVLESLFSSLVEGRES